MCGITGYINLKKKVNPKNIVKMNTIIKHRGPDDEGYLLINKDEVMHAYGEDTVSILKKQYSNIKNMPNNYNIFLAHRRLSIIDLSEKGHQPMEDQKNNIYIIFNGEIYNYLEIREELQKIGYIFHTNSDTEVIIKAYKEWGEKCVDKFNGMWAFAIYDKANSSIFCSRDRFGIKPFYYYYDDEKIIFGSEIKQILEDETVKRVANDKAIFNYLFYGINDYNNETFFENIYALEPSFNMNIKIDFTNQKFEIKKYQYYSLKEETSRKTEEDATKEFKKEFERSIEYRLRSDIPVGSCLSGGLDSSSVVTTACKFLEKEQKNNQFETFTSCYDENLNIDERHYSKKVVQRTGCKENLVFPNKEDLEGDLKKVIWHQDSPFPGLSIYAQWCVMKRANKEEIKVLLDGQGGDETLLGYERYIIFLLKEDLTKFNIRKFVNDFKIYKEAYNLSFSKVIKFLLHFSNNHYLQYSKRYIKELMMNCINKNFLKEYKKNKDYIGNMKFKNCFELQKSELFHSNLPPLLRYEDRNSMAFSIETRVPFLDYKLVEKAMQIPLEGKIDKGYTKYVLRKAMQEDMDEEVIFRKNKLGFAAPQKNWLDKLSDEFIEKYLSDFKSLKYFNKKEIEKIFKEKINDEMRWKFLSIELWLDVYKVEIT